MNTCCGCPMCQRSIGLKIERLFMRRPEWLELYDVQELAELSWVDDNLYLLVFGRMVALGLILESRAPDEEPPVYLLARCMVSAQALAASVERWAA